MITARIENNELIYEGEPIVDENYPGFCCEGFDFIISLVWQPVRPWDIVTGYGNCQNPECPNNWDGTPNDPYRGVNSWDIEYFALELAERAELSI